LRGNWAKQVASFKKRVSAPYSFEEHWQSSLPPSTPEFECNKASVASNDCSTEFAEKATGQIDNECLSKMLEQEEQKFY